MASLGCRYPNHEIKKTVKDLPMAAHWRFGNLGRLLKRIFVIDYRNCLKKIQCQHLPTQLWGTNTSPVGNSIQPHFRPKFLNFFCNHFLSNIIEFPYKFQWTTCEKWAMKQIILCIHWCAHTLTFSWKWVLVSFNVIITRTWGLLSSWPVFVEFIIHYLKITGTNIYFS